MVASKSERRSLVLFLLCAVLFLAVSIGCAGPVKQITITEISSAEVSAVSGAIRAFLWKGDVYVISVDPATAKLTLFQHDEEAASLFEKGTIQASQFSSPRICGLEIGWLHESAACFMVTDCRGESQLFSFRLDQGFKFEWEGALSLTGGGSSYPGAFVVGSGRELILFSLQDEPKHIATPAAVIGTATLDSGHICALMEDGGISIFDLAGKTVFQNPQPFWKNRKGLSALGSHLFFVADSQFRRNESVGVITSNAKGEFVVSSLGALPEGGWVISKTGGLITFHDLTKGHAPVIAWPPNQPSGFRTLSLPNGGTFLPSDSSDNKFGYFEEGMVRVFQIASN